MGASEVDRLEIVVEAQAGAANKQLNVLAANLKNVSSVLSGMKTSNIGRIGGVSTGSSGSVGRLTTSLSGLNNAFRKANTSSHSLAYSFGKFYANCFMLIRGVKSLGKAINSSMDFIETVDYYGTVVNKIGTEFSDQFAQAGYDSADSYAKSFNDRMQNLTGKMTGYTFDMSGNATSTGSKSLSLDVNAMTDYQASILAVTNSLGLAGEVSLNTAKAFSMLAADESSLRNVDLSTVMTNLTSGLIGQSRALYKYGIDITNNTLQQYALANGISKSVSEMSQSEKMQLRLIAILDQSRVAWGNMADTLNTPANQLRILKQNFTNLARVIGNLFMPIVSKVLPYINALVMALQRLFTYVAGVFGIDLSGISAGMGSMDDAYSDLIGDTDDLTDSTEEANKAAKKLKSTVLGIDELNVNNPDTDSGSSSGSSGGSGIDLSGAIDDALANYEAIWNEAFKNMNNKAQEMADKICRMFKNHDWEGIGLVISNGISNGLDKVDWDSVYNHANNFGEGIARFLNGLLTPKLFISVGKTFAGCINTVIETGLGFVEKFNWKQAGKSFGVGLNTLIDGIEWEKAGKLFGEYFSGLISSANEFLTTTNWKKLGKSIHDFIKNAINNLDWNGLKSLFKNLFGALIDTLSGLVGIKSEALEKLAIALASLYASVKLFQLAGAANSALAGLQGSLSALGLLDLTGISTGFAGIGAMISQLGPIALGAAAAIAIFAKVFSDLNVTQGEINEALGGESWSNLSDKIAVTTTNVEELKKSIENLTTGYEDSITSATAKSGEIDGLIDSYFELRDNTALTADEQEHMKNMAKALVDYMPELQESYDETTGYIDSTKDAMNGLCESVTKEIQAEAERNYLTDLYEKYYDSVRNLDDAYSDYKDVVSETSDKFSELERKYNTGEITLSEYKVAQDELNSKLKDACTNFSDSADSVDDTAEKINGLTEDLYGQKDCLDTYSIALKNNNTGMSTSLTQLRDASSGTYLNMTSDVQEFEKNSKNSLDGSKKSIDENSDSFDKLKSSASNSTSSATSDLSQYATETWRNGTSAKQSIDTNSNAFDNLREKVSGATSSSNRDIQGYKSNASTNFSSSKSSIDGNSSSITSLKDNITKSMNISTSNIKSFSSSANSNFNSTSGTAKNMSTSIDSSTESAKNLYAQSGRSFTIGADFSVLDKLKSSLSDIWSNLTNIFSKNGQTVNIGVNASGSGTTKGYATGGFPESGQLFMARENGMNEFVGHMGSHPAVANNDQIVQGIAYGVASANSQQNALLVEQNSLLRQLLAKDTGVYIGDREIARANARGQKEIGMTLRTT